MNTIETDYLIIGAGAAGMAFADSLMASCDADVVMIDRKHQPGGHWNDAYPFVKLHQPSAIYGVNSMQLGNNSIDAIGSDAGYYERAGAAEVSGYFKKVLESILLPTGRLRFFGMCDYTGDFEDKHIYVSRLTGARTQVRVRRKVVDTTYLQVRVPATHVMPFKVDQGARVIPVGELVSQAEPASGYTILGGGKTAMDACYWLLSNGIDPDRITWVRPRDSWVLDRKIVQPLDKLACAIEMFDLGVEAMAKTSDFQYLVRLLEDAGQIQRFDPSVTPTMYRGAILSTMEFEALKGITRVVRQGHVRWIGSSRIVMDNGDIATDPKQIHVDCSAAGVDSKPEVPIYSSRRITLQGLVGGFTTFSAALIGFVEAARDEDTEKNKILTPVSPLNHPIDWVKSNRGFLDVSALQGGVGGADIADWLESARLNLTVGMNQAMRDDPKLAAGVDRIVQNTPNAIANAQQMLGEKPR